MNAISMPGITKTCRAKKRESVEPAMIGPPNSRFTIHGPITRNSARDRRADANPPERILIETKNLPRERHAQRHQQKKNTDDPGEFSRILEGAEQKDLHHVNQNDRDHEVRAPAMERADVPAERDGMIQRLQAVPGLTRRRNVDHARVIFR